MKRERYEACGMVVGVGMMLVACKGFVSDGLFSTLIATEVPIVCIGLLVWHP